MKSIKPLRQIVALSGLLRINLGAGQRIAPVSAAGYPQFWWITGEQPRQITISPYAEMQPCLPCLPQHVMPGQFFAAAILGPGRCGRCYANTSSLHNEGW